MTGLGAQLPRPKAILSVSAHWETDRPAVSGASHPETIHDFFGFPDALYRLSYPAPGAPQLARRVAQVLSEAGMSCDVNPARGLDHGAWNPLLLAYPDADIPVAQLSIQAHLDPAHHLGVGQALRQLRDEDVLILASGGAVHNLRQFQVDREKPAAWAVAFEEWLVARVEAADEDELVGYRMTQPQARQAHPRDEHFLPLFVAMGAGGGPGRALHRSFAHGSLSMAAFAWGLTAN